jgi:hypothetical protein
MIRSNVNQSGSLDSGARLNARSAGCLLIAVLTVLAIGACVDEGSLYDPAGDYFRDTTPPSLVSITPVDAYHVDLEFHEVLYASDASNRTNYAIIELDAPLDPIAIVGARLKNDQKTITISTGSSMEGIDCRLTVKSVSDANRNRIQAPVVGVFTGSTTADETPPEVIYHHHAIFEFSEGVTIASVTGGVSWWSDKGPVPFDVVQYQTGFFLKPNGTVGSNTLYTVRLAGIQDPAGNTMPDVEWSFTLVP